MRLTSNDSPWLRLHRKWPCCAVIRSFILIGFAGTMIAGLFSLKRMLLMYSHIDLKSEGSRQRLSCVVIAVADSLFIHSRSIAHIADRSLGGRFSKAKYKATY